MEFKDGLEAMAKMCRVLGRGCDGCPMKLEDGDCLVSDYYPADFDIYNIVKAVESEAEPTVSDNKCDCTNEKLPVNRLHAEVKKVLTKIDALFEQKNLQYREGVDEFANFTKGAALRYGRVTMATRFEALKDMCEKHIAHVYNHPLAGVKVDESLMDIAVYMILALVMHKRMTDGERIVPIEDVDRYVRKEYF